MDINGSKELDDEALALVCGGNGGPHLTVLLSSSDVNPDAGADHPGVHVSPERDATGTLLAGRGGNGAPGDDQLPAFSGRGGDGGRGGAGLPGTHDPADAAGRGGNGGLYWGTGGDGAAGLPVPGDPNAGAGRGGSGGAGGLLWGNGGNGGAGSPQPGSSGPGRGGNGGAGSPAGPGGAG